MEAFRVRVSSSVLSLALLLTGSVGDAIAQADGAKRITRSDAVKERQDFEKSPKVALVVGVGGYPQSSGLSTLKYAAKDAAMVGDVLKRQGYLVRVLTDGDALRGSVRRSLSELSGAIDKDRGTFLFYFSGHGFADHDTNYLATYGTTVDDLKAEGFPVSEVESILKNSGAKRQLMFIDACRNEPTVGGKSVAQQGFVAERLQKLDAAAGLHVLFSTKSGTVSYESKDLQQGVFTHFLLKGLQGEADGYSTSQKDGLVTFQDLAQFVVDGVRAYGVEHGQLQVPYQAGESSGDFLLTSRRVSPPVAPSPQTAAPTPQPPAPKPTPTEITQQPAQPAGTTPSSGGIGDLADKSARLGQLPQRWRNTVTSQVYVMRFDSDHLIINQLNGPIVADLALKKDPKHKKPDKYEGYSRLANCPEGQGVMEVTSWSATRIEGRVQVAAVANGQKINCSNTVSFLRSWSLTAFIPD